MMRANPAHELWVERARAVSTLDAALKIGFSPLKTASKTERVGPCPTCDGVDRFSVVIAGGKAGVWNCRGCGLGGNDGIGLAMKVKGLDFPKACEELVGPPPAGTRWTEEEKRAFAEQQAALKLSREADEARRARETEADRRQKLIWATDLWERGIDWRGTLAEAYLRHRGIEPGNLQNLRFVPDLRYRHNDRVIWTGPAMLARILLDGALIGVQRYWLDPMLAQGLSGGKGRPELIDRATGEVLKTKKTLGEFVGGSIVLIDGPEPRRMFAGEGTETVLAVHSDMAGNHSPLLGRATFRAGVSLHNLRNIAVPDSVSQLFLLGDGDSDPAFTRSAMDAAARSLARPGLSIHQVFALPGTDFASMRKEDAN